MKYANGRICHQLKWLIYLDQRLFCLYMLPPPPPPNYLLHCSLPLSFFIGNKFCQLIAPKLSCFLHHRPLRSFHSLSLPIPLVTPVTLLSLHTLHPSLPAPPCRSPFPSCWPQCLLCHCLSIFLCLHWWDWPDRHTHAHTHTSTEDKAGISLGCS